MPQVFNASLSVTLPEAPSGMATTAAALLASWAELVEKLEEVNPGMKSQFGINETRAKAAVEPGGVKRGRKPRQPPALVPSSDLLQEPGGEAA